MNAPKKPALALEPPPDFADPRNARGFDPSAWPLCNAAPGPLPGSADLYDRRCLEFLALYYKLNVLNKRLLAAQKRSAKSSTAKKTLLGQINKTLTALEKLEDRYTPIGFFGEPTMDGVFYRDITFVRPELPRIYPPLQSSHIAIPGLEHIPASELHGPVKIIRFGHGKVDL
jgi:hypothetical protein